MPEYLDKSDIVGNCRLLPFDEIDIDKVLQEIKLIPEEMWNAKYRATVHKDTSSVFLKGNPPIERIPEDNDQPVFSLLPYTRDMIYNKLPGSPGKCLVARLKPNGVIMAHIDGGTTRNNENALTYDYFKSTLRIHIPVVTNKNVHFFIKDRFYYLSTGSGWIIDNSARHGVINQDPEMTRIHIIVDIYPTQNQIDQIMSCSQPDGWIDNNVKERLMPKRA